MEISDLELLFERVDRLERNVGPLLDRVSLLEVGVGHLKERIMDVEQAVVRLGDRLDELDQEAPAEPASTWFVVDEDGDALSRACFNPVHTANLHAMKFFNEEDATRLLHALKAAGMVGLRLKEVRR